MTVLMEECVKTDVIFSSVMELSTSYFIFYGKMASWPISCAARMLVKKLLTVEMFMGKIPRPQPRYPQPPLPTCSGYSLQCRLLCLQWLQLHPSSEAAWAS